MELETVGGLNHFSFALEKQNNGPTGFSISTFLFTTEPFIRILTTPILNIGSNYAT